MKLVHVIGFVGSDFFRCSRFVILCYLVLLIIMKASTIFGVLIEFSGLIEKSKERHVRKEKQLKRRESTTVK